MRAEAGALDRLGPGGDGSGARAGEVGHASTAGEVVGLAELKVAPRSENLAVEGNSERFHALVELGPEEFAPQRALAVDHLLRRENNLDLRLLASQDGSRRRLHDVRTGVGFDRKLKVQPRGAVVFEREDVRAALQHHRRLERDVRRLTREPRVVGDCENFQRRRRLNLLD